MFLTRFFNTYNNTRVFQSKVNSSVRKRIYILRPNPDNLRKMQLQGIRLDIEPGPCISRPTLYQLSYRSRCRELGCEFCIYIYIYIYIYICIYIVKYKGVLKIIFGIYTRCQQIDVSQSKVNSSAEIYTIEDPTGTSFFLVPVGS